MLVTPKEVPDLRQKRKMTTPEKPKKHSEVMREEPPKRNLVLGSSTAQEK